MVQKTSLFFIEDNYVSLDVCDSPMQIGNVLRMDDIPDLLKILIILKKNDVLSSPFMKENGLKGLSRSGLQRKSIIAKIAFHLYMKENPEIIERLMYIDTQNFERYNHYIFSESGVFWRRIDSGNDSSFANLAVKRDLLNKRNIVDISTILTQQSLYSLFEIDKIVTCFHARKCKLLCEF